MSENRVLDAKPRATMIPIAYNKIRPFGCPMLMQSAPITYTDGVAVAQIATPTDEQMLVLGGFVSGGQGGPSVPASSISTPSRESWARTATRAA